MANYLKDIKKIISLVLVLFVFFILIKPLYASSVTVEGYTPLLSNYSNKIANNSYMTVNPSKIVYNERSKITVRIYSDKNHPLINQQVVLSSPQKKYGLSIIQPKTPTNKYGIAYGYVYSKYNSPQEYIILAVDTTYTEYPIIIKKNVNIEYLPS